MKVVQINSIYGDKSTGIIVRDIDWLLQKYGYESFFVSRDGGHDLSNHISIGNPLDYSLHAIRTRVDGKQGFASKRTTEQLLKRLNRIKPDILHLHNVHSNFINLPLLFIYAKTNQIPVVLSLHDCWFFTGKCFHFKDVRCEKWKTGCGDCPKRYSDIPSYLYDSSSEVWSRKKDLYHGTRLHVVGCSRWICELAKQSPLFSSADVSYIHNGVDLALFAFREKKSDEAFTIMTMANKWFSPQNAEVRERVLKELKESDKLVIVGCTDDHKKMYADNMQVVCEGFVREKGKLAEIYEQSDVFLNLTHIDTLPTVNMEALSCGTPVITYDAGGSSELVENGVTGYIVGLDDVSGIIVAIDNIRKGEISRASCRSYAERKFDKNNNYKEYLRLYDKIGGKNN